VLPVGRAAGGEDDVDRAVAGDLTAAGFTSEAVADVMAWKRAKLLRNLGNALDALCAPAADDDETAALRRLEDGARAEATACFAAAGLPVVDDERYRASLTGYEVRPVGGRERGGGSTWQSVARRQGSVETDWLNGEIARLGRLHGVPTPVNALLQREMWRLVADGGEPGSRRPSALAALLPA
jgi:2-dehydropantoate 2-reductase